MPKRIGERAVRYANAISITFRCPYPSCGQTNSYTEGVLNWNDLCCRHCRRFFAILTFEKDRLRCDGCHHRLETVHYREGAGLHRFCESCTEIFDDLVAQADAVYARWLRGIVSLLRAVRALRKAADLTRLRSGIECADAGAGRSNGRVDGHQGVGGRWPYGHSDGANFLRRNLFVSTGR